MAASYRRTRCPGSAAARTFALVAAACAFAGGLLACDRAKVGTRPPVADQVRLRQRALDFLYRAARSELDVVAGNAIEALVQVDPRAAVPTFRAALNSEFPIVRFAGLVALGETRDCGAADRLAKALDDPHEQVRLGAAFAAFMCGQRGYGRRLTDALHDSGDEHVRSTAAMLIGRTGEAAALGHLRHALGDEANVVRIQVIASMAELGDEEAVDRLIQYAQGDAVMRIVALQTMVELADPRTRDALLYRLSLEDEHIQHRLIAARALGRIGRRAGGAASSESGGSGAAASAHEGYELARRSLSFSPGDASSELTAAERAEEAVRVRSLAALALGDIGDPRALPALESLASSADDPRVKLAASVAICHIVQPALPRAGR